MVHVRGPKSNHGLCSQAWSGATCFEPKHIQRNLSIMEKYINFTIADRYEAKSCKRTGEGKKKRRRRKRRRMNLRKRMNQRRRMGRRRNSKRDAQENKKVSRLLTLRFINLLSAEPSFYPWYPGGQRLKVISFS